MPQRFDPESYLPLPPAPDWQTVLARAGERAHRDPLAFWKPVAPAGEEDATGLAMTVLRNVGPHWSVLGDQWHIGHDGFGQGAFSRLIDILKLDEIPFGAGRLDPENWNAEGLSSRNVARPRLHIDAYVDRKNLSVHLTWDRDDWREPVAGLLSTQWRTEWLRIDEGQKMISTALSAAPNPAAKLHRLLARDMCALTVRAFRRLVTLAHHSFDVEVGQQPEPSWTIDADGGREFTGLRVMTAEAVRQHRNTMADLKAEYDRARQMKAIRTFFDAFREDPPVAVMDIERILAQGNRDRVGTAIERMMRAGFDVGPKNFKATFASVVASMNYINPDWRDDPASIADFMLDRAPEPRRAP